MAAILSNINEQVYNVREDASLPSRVALVICILAQRSLSIAGFSITKELLTIHHIGYAKNKPVWDLDFFEQSITNQPLLAVREKVKGVFIGSHKNMVVPDEIYSEREAENWLAKLFFVELRDEITKYRLHNDNATYLQAIPVNISELLKINFRKAAVIPLPANHFGDKQVQSLYLQCTVSSEQVTATLHNYSQLLWHKVFDYSCAEDIAYAIKLLCSENYIDAAKLNIACCALSGAEYDVINELTQYFPAIKGGDSHTIHARWEPSISLATQLLECVL